MNIQIITVPYDLGHESVRKGRAPGLFIEKGLEGRLRESGHEVTKDRIRLDEAFLKGQAFPSEIGTIFEINRALSLRVRSAAGAGRFPLVLTGNCNSCIGTLAGLADRKMGIVWFDAHGDFNTPETTRSGYFDGMGLAVAAGRCWQGMLNTIEGFKPVADNCIIHSGASGLDSQEREMLLEAGIPLVMTPGAADNGNLGSLADALARLPQGVEGIYLHLDMDVFLGNGLSAQMVSAAIGLIKERFKIEGCVVASYDPGLDNDYHILYSGIDLILDMVSA